MATSLGLEVSLSDSYQAAVARTREALKAEGFGILTEVDLQQAFRDKLDQDFRPYVMLGACNPPLAYRALQSAPEIGLLLPCNGGDSNGWLTACGAPPRLRLNPRMQPTGRRRTVLCSATARLERICARADLRARS